MSVTISKRFFCSIMSVVIIIFVLVLQYSFQLFYLQNIVFDPSLVTGKLGREIKNHNYLYISMYRHFIFEKIMLE